MISPIRDAQLQIASTAVRSEVARRRRQHSAMVSSGLVVGEWSDNTWRYAGRRIAFIRLKGRTGPAIPLEGAAADLARIAAIHAIATTASPGTVIDHVRVVRIIEARLGNSLSRWSALTKSDFLSLERWISEQDWSEPTKYGRLCQIGTVLKLFNSIEHSRKGKVSRLLPIRINWKHRMKDPLRAWIEDNGERKGFGGRGDIPDGLERAIGELRTSVIESDEANPREGYDSIRLDSLVFKFSLGIRIGEVVTTPLNCLDVEAVTQSPFLRVWTEKNQVPFARPIPHIWYQPVSEAITEITALTKGARARARQIEESGFQFVDKALSDYRMLHPLSKVEKCLIRAMGFKERDVAWPREIDECLDEPAKSFERKQRNSLTTIKTPSVYMAAMVAWLDERFERWDWQDKRVAKYGRKRDHLSRWAVLTEVAIDVGISMSEIKRNKKNNRLSKFIDTLDRFGIRPGMAPPQGAEGASLRSMLKRLWQKERAALMSRSRWESYQTLVVMSKWREVLEEKFRHSLRMHYKTEDVSCYIGPNAKAPRASLGPKSQLLSEHLFVVWENQFDLRTPRKGVLPVPMTHNHVYSYLCSNVKRATAFSRFGIKGPDGKPFSVAPHQIRHWLTTAMMKSGPNEVMVDLWMGRTPGQSRIYDHRTARERAEAARSRYLVEEPPNDYLGRQIIRWRHAGLTRSKIAALIGVRLQILHFTPWGACARELSVMPCQKALACVRGYGSSRGCPHFVPNFSDTEARLNLEKLLRDYQGLLISLEPRYDELKDRFRAELNTSEPLDQHLAFLHDMTAGIKTVLHEYKRHDEATVEKEAK